MGPKVRKFKILKAQKREQLVPVGTSPLEVLVPHKQYIVVVSGFKPQGNVSEVSGSRSLDGVRKGPLRPALPCLQ